MNFLQLCQRAAVECGVASTVAITTALPNTANASGSLGRIVNWVNDAWSDVQMKHPDWGWMRSSNILGAGISFQTVAGQASYPLGTGAGKVGVAVDSFGQWDCGTFRNYTTSVGFQNETPLDDVPFDYWRDVYMFGANRSVQTRPDAIAIGPDQSLNLGPPPNGLYTVTGDYFLAASEMAADTDVPTGLPTQFHMLIVYTAMIKYAGYEAASEVASRGADEAGKLMKKLEALRLPGMSFAGALA